MKIFFRLGALVALALAPLPSHAAKQWKYTQLYNFCTQDQCVDGGFPVAGLTQDAKGNLFGTTESGGKHGQGVVFELQRRGRSWKYKVLHSFCFSCGDGDFPASSLIVDVDGNVYGTTLGGGGHDCGMIFELTPATKALKVLHAFCSQADDGNSPDAALSYVGKSSGALYDGVSPLYGTTPRGGAHGRGTAFKLTANGGTWALTTLYAFCGEANCADGSEPSGELLVDASGNLFGNAGGGGSGNAGVVYEISQAGKRAQPTETVLYSFCSQENCADGQQPAGALAMNAQGEMFGTTENADNHEGGAIFKLTPTSGGWQESVPHIFCAIKCKDGYLPSGGVIADSAGGIYGLNEAGGAGEDGIGAGVMYRLDQDGLKPLYAFCSEQNCDDGRGPAGTLIMDPHGALFGVTTQGGPNSGAGTMFELAP
jgi:uncharacterized repeat protein (TIGR03803 family)